MTKTIKKNIEKSWLSTKSIQKRFLVHPLTTNNAIFLHSLFLGLRNDKKCNGTSMAQHSNISLASFIWDFLDHYVKDPIFWAIFEKTRNFERRKYSLTHRELFWRSSIFLVFRFRKYSQNGNKPKTHKNGVFIVGTFPFTDCIW